MTEKTRLLPIVDDLDTSEFFRAAGEGRLVVQVCVQCNQSLHLPRARCFVCGSMETTWLEVEGTGTVYTWTVVEHQVHPYYPTPFTVVLVELDDRPDVRLLGHIPGRPVLEAGSSVRVRFQDLGNGNGMPNWELDHV